MVQSRQAILAFSMLTGLLVTTLSNVSLAETAEIETASAELMNENLPLDQLRNFSDIFARIKSD